LEEEERWAEICCERAFAWEEGIFVGLGETLADEVNDLEGVDADAGAGEPRGASFGILLGIRRDVGKLRVAVRIMRRGIVQMGMGSGGKKLYLVKIAVTLVTIPPVRFGFCHSVIGYINFIHILGQSFEQRTCIFTTAIAMGHLLCCLMNKAT
jgi:hypothetical protein